MADHDEEDLFADLYENEDAPSASAPAPAAPVAQPQPESAPVAEETYSAPAQAESAPLNENIANGSNGPDAYQQNFDLSYGNGPQQPTSHENQSAQNYNYNDQNDGGNDYGAAQHQEQEDYKPIGIKEDG